MTSADAIGSGADGMMEIPQRPLAGQGISAANRLAPAIAKARALFAGPLKLRASPCAVP